MKYEMIFGDEKLFDGAPEDAIAIRVNDYKKITYYHHNEDDLKSKSMQDLHAIPIVAMRRIIKTPVWTVADQKAWRLPEVGSMLNNKTRGECTFIGFGDDDKTYWALKLKNDLIYIVNKNWCTPIESPEEKAARLEDEFVKSEMKDTTLSIEWACIYERGVRAAYRKLSGAPAAPKGGSDEFISM